MRYGEGQCDFCGVRGGKVAISERRPPSAICVLCAEKALAVIRHEQLRPEYRNEAERRLIEGARARIDAARAAGEVPGVDDLVGLEVRAKLSPIAQVAADRLCGGGTPGGCTRPVGHRGSHTAC